MESNPRRRSRLGSSSSMPATVALACIGLALITTIWAVVNHNRISSLSTEVNDLRAQITTLRENANATAYTFVATDIAPSNVQGVAYIGTSGSGAVVISNLPPAGDNEVYQLWLLGETNDDAVAAGALLTNQQGQGFALLPADASRYVQIAISLEPEGGKKPSGAFLLVAEVNPARGLYPGVLAVCQNLFE
jgi:outer membrane murein-binding lipoprotein Lpp